jgi:hypothetical protein
MMWLVVVALLLLLLLVVSKERYIGVCHGHCLKNKSGLVEDAWDCCECISTVNGTYNQGFQKCMCDLQYKDFCFNPVTNFLLSQ